jgi:hypothetical protein
MSWGSGRVLATHEAAAVAIRNQRQSIRVTATLTESTLAVEVHAPRSVHPLNVKEGMRLEPERIEPYQLIAGLIDQVNLAFDANGTTVRMVQNLDEG